MRLLITLLFCLPGILCATTGPGPTASPPYAGGLALDTIIAQMLNYQPDDALLEGEASVEEKLTISAAFAAPAAISDRGDDLRRVAALSDSARVEIAKMRGVLDMVRSEARQISSLTEAALTSLPLGIHQRIGNIDVHLAIAEARLTATQAEVDIYLRLDLPNTNQDPIFIARGVGWSRQGGFTGDIDLELVADWGIDFNAGATRLILKKTTGERDGSFVTVNCDGFVAGRLEATVLISRDWVIPVYNRVVQTNESLGSDSIEYRTEDRVHADFTIDITNGAGFLVEVNLEQAFVFTTKPDVEITIGAIAIDLSDAVNPSGMYFPENYHSPHVEAGFAAATWQGFYLRGLEVRLPDQYSKRSGEPLTIGAPYLILDRSGFTGHFYADNILPLGERSASGWAISVDTFELKITQNTFESARLNGLINVPLLAGAADNCYVTLDPGAPVGNIRRDDCLGYSAHIGRNSLDFSVRTNTQYCVNLWKADLVIEPNSRIDLSYADGRFDAFVILNGSLLIDAEISPDVSFTMDSLSFDNLTLSNREPYFSPGVWDFPKSITARLKNFDLSFTHINLSVDSLRGDGSRSAALNFNTRLNVDGKMKLNCEGMFKLTGYLKETEGKQQWRFQKLKVKAFRIDASTDSWGIKATIAFYEHDAKWGTGFYGAGKLRISALGGSEIAAVAQFGTIGNDQSVEEKYFFVDVMAKFGSGVTLPGGIQLMGIGGGVYKNMTRVTGIGQSFANPNDTQITLARNKVNQAAATQSPFDGLLGESTSGTKYVVDLENGFGVFLQVIIAGENEEAFSVNARLELEVRDDGGWRAALDGNVTIMGPVNFDNNPKKTEGIGIFIHMSYVKSETYTGFKATADVFVNIKDNTISGGLRDSIAPPSDTARVKRIEFVAANMGYAGNISLEFSTQQWYIHIGYPKFPGQPVDKRIALAMRILGADVGTASYFCVGQNVPPIPPLPARVSALTGEMDMSRDFSLYESAAGFAFGTELSLYAEGQFLIFYYDLAAGLGFDINVRNYGDAICVGDDPNGAGIGVDGWYAAGQAYAYVEGEVGVQAPWWMGSFRVPILNAGVAAVLQVKAPNPVWARGVIAGYYNVLGGVLKGRFRVEGEFGDNCVIAGRNGEDPFASLDAIASMSPDSASIDVATNTTMQAYLVMPIDEVTELGSREYIVQVVSAELRDHGTGDLVAGTRVAARGAFSLVFIPEDYLAGATEYAYTVEVRIRGRNVGTGAWESEDVKRETRTHTFRTAETPFALDPGNIKYNYPVAGQANFYRREYAQGFLKVRRKQPSLTENVTAVYRTQGRSELTAEVTWRDADNRYDWEHPRLMKDRVYAFSLVRNYAPPVVAGGGGNGGGNPSGGQNQPGGGAGLPDGGPNPFWTAPVTVMVATPPSEEEPTNQELVVFHFRVSKYNTFADKLAAIFIGTPLSGGMGGLNYTFTNTEAFDSLEVFGNLAGMAPMVKMAVTSEENFTTRGLREYIFDNLPFSCPNGFPDYRKWQNIDAEIPWGAVSLSAEMGEVTDQEYESGNVAGQNAGGEFSLGFVNVVSMISRQVAQAAETTLRLMLREMIGNYINGEPGVAPAEVCGPYYSCFPSINTVLAGVAPTGDMDALNTSSYEDSLLEDLVGNLRSSCDLPEALIEMYQTDGNLRLLRFDDTSFPVTFNYVLPNGIVQPAISYTFQN